MKHPDPYRAFRFRVDIDQIQSGGFQSVSGLERECQIEAYREGGVNDYEHQFVTLTKYPPLILKRGLVDASLWEWHKEVINGNVVRNEITVVLFDETGEEAWKWIFCEAFPSKWTGAELDATANNVATESVEFVHHGMRDE
ncbi:MAG: phage tail protein [Proteobacteria bacterium]|nr:phage tail protein [Pseudomonadota bacterium]